MVFFISGSDGLSAILQQITEYFGKIDTICARFGGNERFSKMAFAIFRQYFDGRGNATNCAILAVHDRQPNPEIRAIPYGRYAPNETDAPQYRYDQL